MDMFRNLGAALRLVREERRLTQASLARTAGIGKSQLSKYESGKEIPKLESLEKLLAVLAIRAVDFFSIVSLLDRELDRINAAEPPAIEEALSIPGLLPEALQTAFAQIHQDLLRLHGLLVTAAVRGPE
ncbi:MAG TPA: helix-turn-helix transcriptional regulator [Thermoanaerobaculia bacterium]|jgi:transcriptional regulator with XRE-family HTH domain